MENKESLQNKQKQHGKFWRKENWKSMKETKENEMNHDANRKKKRKKKVTESYSFFF